MVNKKVILFCIGFLSCWVIMGLITIATDEDWIQDKFLTIIILPILIVYCPITLIFEIIKIQWYSVIHPITQQRFNEIIDIAPKEQLKYLHIKNFYIIYDKKSWWTKKLIFLRIKN